MSLFCEMLLATATSSQVGQTNKGWSHIAKFFGRLWRKFSVCVRDKSLPIKKILGPKTRRRKKLLRNKKGRLVRLTFPQQFYFGWKATTLSLYFLNQSDLIHRLVDFIDWVQRVKNIGIFKYLCPVCDMYIPMICIFVWYVYSFVLYLYLF